MAVEIIKPGMDQNPVLIGTCHLCGCVFKCKKSDIVYPDRPTEVGYIKCPTSDCRGQIVEDKLKVKVN